MKAYFVWIMDEWGDFVHGETAGKAKSMFWQEWAQEADEWINMRPIRVSALDDVPLTRQNIKEYQLSRGHSYMGEEYTEWWPICDCPICKGNSND